MWTQSRPVGDGCDEAYGGEEVASGLVVSGGDAAAISGTAEGSLDDVEPLVALGVVRDVNLARRGAEDDRDGAALGEETTQVVSVVALVAGEFAERRNGRKQRVGGGNVGDVAARQQERVRASLVIAERVDLGGAPVARAADRLLLGVTVAPPFLRQQPSDAPSPRNCRSG